MQYVHAGPPGQERTFLLLVPSSYKAENPAPLWVLAPGGFDAPETFLDMAGMMAFSERRNFVVATLQGEDHLLNVGLHGRNLPGLPDDIGYTRAVLQKVTQNLCIDMDRIRCAGFSRGARFCSRVASELSSFFAGIAAVSGLRFPSPNNATRPMPLIAFHGTKDRINPYWGDGDPKYWHASVDDTVKRWVDFNGCREHKWKRLSPQVVASHHTNCTDRADVVLVIIEGGGHTWPGSRFAVDTRKFGRTTHEIMANDLIWNFFVQHPRESGCHTAERHEPCHTAVEEAMLNGLDLHPEWRDRLTYSSSFRDFQAVLHDDVLADCPRPCPPPTAPPLPTTTTTTSTTATTTTATTTGTTTTATTTTVTTTTVSSTTITSTATTTTTLVPPTATITSTTVTTTTATTTTATTTTATTTTTTTATATTTTATATSTRTTATRTSTTGTTTTTSPPTTTRALDPRVAVLDGSWTHKSDPGRFIELIKDGMVHWDNGPTKEIHVQENGLFATLWQGQTYHCNFLGGELMWDDGDVWIRVQPAPGQGGIPAPPGAVVTVRRIEDTASSAWWARLPGGAAGAGAGAHGAVLTALAAAGLALVLGLVLWRAWRPWPRLDGYSGLHRSPVVPFELLHEPSAHDAALLAE